MSFLKRTLQCALLFVFTLPAITASSLLHPQWVRQLGGSSGADTYAVVADSARHVYLTGEYDGPLQIGGTNLTVTGDGDFYLAKYDRAGNPVWARSAGGAGFTAGFALGIDTAGNVAVAGSFETNVVFAGTNLMGQGLQSLFVARYDAAGNLLWARSAGGANAVVLSTSLAGLAVDTASNIFVTGNFEGTVVFGGTTLTNVPAGDLFLVKYSPAGNVLWALQSSANTASASAVATDSGGNVYLTGDFQGAARFGRTNVFATNSGIAYQMFVAKFDAAGTPVWLRSASGTSLDGSSGVGIAVHPAGQVFVAANTGTGLYQLGAQAVTNIGHNDGLLAKFDFSGGLSWLRQVGGTGTNGTTFAKSLAADAATNVYFTGEYRSLISAGTLSLTNAGQDDVFLVKYDSSGNALQARRLGGTGSDRPMAVATSGSDTVFLNGFFRGSVDFGSTNFTSVGSSDLFLARIETGSAPRLSVTTNNGSLLLSWPLTAADYLLEATPVLEQPFAPLNVSVTSNLAQQSFNAVIAPTNTQSFFRLHKP